MQIVGIIHNVKLLRRQDNMSKILYFDKSKYLHAVNSLPKNYTLSIKRNVKMISEVNEWTTESFTWEASEDILNHKAGNVLMSEHLITILASLAEENVAIAENIKLALKRDFSKILGDLPDDSDFNR